MNFFCGDPHGHFGHIIEAVLEHQPTAVILLGDMHAYSDQISHSIRHKNVTSSDSKRPVILSNSATRSSYRLLDGEHPLSNSHPT